MSTPRTLPLGQSWFLDAAKEIVGEKLYNAKGMCHGFSYLAAQAVTNQSLSVFKERLQWIHYGPPKLESKSEELSPQKKSELAALAKEYLQLQHKEKEKTKAALKQKALHDKTIFSEAEIDNDAVNYFANFFEGNEEVAIEWIFSGTPTGYPDVITPVQLKSLIQIAQGIAALYSKRFQDEALSVDEHVLIETRLQKLNDIKIFYEGLSAYYQPDHDSFSPLFEEEKKPIAQKDVNLLFPLFAPVELDIEKKDKIDTRMQEIANFTGMYTQDKIFQYFKSLQDSLDKHLERLKKNLNSSSQGELPFTIMLGSINHSIGITYNALTKKWVIMDANNANIYEVDLKDIGPTIAEAFILNKEIKKNSIMALGSSIVIDNNSKFLKGILNDWQNSAAFQTLHEVPAITPAQPEQKDDVEGATLLHIAAIHGDLERVKKSLVTGADPEFKNKDGVSAWNVTQSKATADVIHQFLINKLVLRIRNYPDKDIDPFIQHVAEGIEKIISQPTTDQRLKISFFELIFNIYKKCVALFKDVKHLSASDPTRIATIQLVKEIDYSKDTKDFFTDDYFKEIKKGNFKVAKLIRQNCFTSEPIDAKGATAMQIALINRDFAAIKFLISIGDTKINIFEKNDRTKQHTLLTYAAKEGLIDLIRDYLPLMITMRHDGYDSALRIAMENNRIDIVKLFLEHGLFDPKYDLDFAKHIGNQTIIKLLEDQIKQTQLIESAYSTKEKLFRNYLGNYLDGLHVTNDSQISLCAIHILEKKLKTKGTENIYKPACAIYDIMQFKQRCLKQANAKDYASVLNGITDQANIVVLSDNGKEAYVKALRDAFNEAVVFGKTELVKIMASADKKFGLLNARDANGMTPLMHASAQGNHAMVKLLLSSGSRPNLDDYDAQGHNALWHAAQQGNNEIFKIFLARIKKSSASPAETKAYEYLTSEAKDLNARYQEVEVFRDISFLADSLAYKPSFFQSWFRSYPQEDYNHLQKLTQDALRQFAETKDLSGKLACRKNLTTEIAKFRDQIAAKHTNDPLVQSIDRSLRKVKL